MESQASEQPWMHCNECSRGFDHHNRLEVYGRSGLRINKSDLLFSMTSCGHIYCENCISSINQQNQSSVFQCPTCNAPSNLYKLEGVLPKRLETYLKPPTGLLEEAVAVMTFQASNANELIRGLREKVSQQKELLTKAKTELAQQRKLREQVASLQNENESLRRQMERGSGTNNGSVMNMKSPAISIRVPGRLSLKSPRIQGIPESSLLHSRVYNTPIKSPMTPYTNNPGYSGYQPSGGYWQPPPPSSIAPRSTAPAVTNTTTVTTTTTAAIVKCLVCIASPSRCHKLVPKVSASFPGTCDLSRIFAPNNIGNNMAHRASKAKMRMTILTGKLLSLVGCMQVIVAF